MWIKYLSKKLKNRRVIFVFSDSAGAKALLSIYFQFPKLFKEVLFVSSKQYNFYKDFEVQVEVFKNNSNDILKNLIQILL